MADEKLNVSWQCVLAAQAANHILSCIKSSVASRLREVMLPLLCSHETPPPGILHTVLMSQQRMAMELLEQVQKRAMKLIKEQEHLPYEDRLKKSRLLSLKKRRLHEDLTAFQYSKGVYKEAGDGTFSRNCNDSTTGNSFKLKYSGFG
ncbi:hypothetical protein BTVI_158611 [Pitangus sulphuratus]|nr:hypothetical protein BTVI_158611 [Pitangus sulphuratus]